ncbi:MAG: EH signature domain-containing protein [Nitrospira sp.]
MGSIDKLRAELVRVNSRLRRESFGTTKSMAQLADEVERRFGTGIAPANDAIAAAVKCFHGSGQVESFRDVKLVCYGISMEVLPERILLLRNPELVGKLLDIVETFRPQVRKYRRCFHALMSAYFEVRPVTSESRPDTSQDGTYRSWLAIRRFLSAGLVSIRHDPMPEWAVRVIEHKNLFDDDPCEPYGSKVLDGNLSEIRETFSTIGIATNSWLQTDVFMAAVRAACNSGDHQFRRHIDVVLTLLKENPGIQLQGLKRVLDRYAIMQPHPEHSAIRAVATDLLGNPLLISNAPRWNGVSPEARTMVSDWIKLKLIEQFFELLSRDGATDSRRLQFWANYVSLIENVWFVLGSGARGNLNPDFKKLRSLMGDQALNLEGGTYGNNAFVMKIGRLLVVEFGETGNAAYLFDARDPPFELQGALHLRDHLKNRRNLGRLMHVDGHQKWEDKFRQAIRDHTEMIATGWETGEQRFHNEQRQRETRHKSGVGIARSDVDWEVMHFCADNGLEYSDQREKRGKFIVYADANNPKISRTLGQWGFKFDRESTHWIRDR